MEIYIYTPTCHLISQNSANFKLPSPCHLGGSLLLSIALTSQLSTAENLLFHRAKISEAKMLPKFWALTIFFHIFVFKSSRTIILAPVFFLYKSFSPIFTTLPLLERAGPGPPARNWKDKLSVSCTRPCALCASCCSSDSGCWRMRLVFCFRSVPFTRPSFWGTASCAPGRFKSADLKWCALQTFCLASGHCQPLAPPAWHLACTLLKNHVLAAAKPGECL